MEKIIEHIGIETLKRYGGQNCCLDDYLFVTDRLENILAGGKTIKMEVLLMIYCMEGEVKLELNNQTCHLKADDLLVSLPNMLIGEVLASPSYKVKIIGLSNRFIQRLTQTEKYTWKSFHYLHRNPVKHFDEENKELFNQYLGLIERKLALCEDPYQKEILLYLSSAFFVELVAAISQQTVVFTSAASCMGIGNSEIIKLVGAEYRAYFSFLPVVLCNNCCTKSTHYTSDIRSDYILTYDFFHASEHCIVKECTALNNNLFSGFFRIS